MITYTLYAIKDADMDTFAPPFLASCDDEAKQIVRDAIQEGSALHRYPTHYHLYRVGVMSHAGDVTADKMCLCSIGDLTYRLPDPAVSLQEATREEVTHE